MKKCPACKAEATKVIYFGMPMYLCSEEYCNTVWGFWSWIPAMRFNGAFMEYAGSYWLALWTWLFKN